MKVTSTVHLLLFISVFNIAWCSDEEENSITQEEGGGGKKNKFILTEKLTPASAKVSYWENPIVLLSSKLSKKGNAGEARYSVNDPSYPIWIPGYSVRPGTDPKNMYKYIPKKNDISLEFEKANSREDNEAFIIDSDEIKQYKAEIKAGDLTQLFGTRQHHDQQTSRHYRIQDLGRRFIPQYPYIEIDKENDMVQDIEDNSLTPKLAPPEIVLAVAKQSALLEAAKPVNPSEHLVDKDILRNGDYWNAFWREDVADPANVLRAPQRNKMKSLSVKLTPGTPIYEHVLKLGKLYPKLLYVVNKN